MMSNNGSEIHWLNLFTKHGLSNLAISAKNEGWQPVWDKLDALCRNNTFASEVEKNIFLDIFFCYCLKYIEDSPDGLILCQLIEKWRVLRKMPERYHAINSEEHGAAVYFCLKLRQKIRLWLLISSDAQLNALPEQYQLMLIPLWSQLFFNIFSPLHMVDDNNKVMPEKFEEPEKWIQKSWPGLLAASMYFPYAAEKFAIDSEQLIKSDTPVFLKTVIIRWMVYIPYFNGALEDLRRLLKYAPELCRALTDNPDFLSQMLFINIAQEVMAGFWRASYLGGNNIDALSSFGDFISAAINKFCRLPEVVSREVKPGQKIRIGYISRNFFQQAVSYYMINRVIHHDSDKFEVFIYALGDYKDRFSEIYERSAEHFQRFGNLKNFTPIVENILRDELDILIFPDIGMDVVTYILAGLRLAPIQCALVGHGTTTGLPTVDYYLSGDFEAPDADGQYREKLIRLPNLGAAQYLPEEPISTITRADLGVAENAVLYISCANGIKHRPERDRLYIEILKRAPNAWIALKPYTAKDGVDGKMARRLRNLAAEAGVGERLVILPSLDNYRNVLGLLTIADVQLDTYPYGGWTTNLEALYVGLPVVTQEGELSRSRWGAGMLKALGVTEGIAKNEEEYVEWAVKFAQDSRLRQEVSKKIKLKAVDTFFNGSTAQGDFEAALLDILAQNQPDSVLNQAMFNKDNDNDQALAKKIDRINVVLPQKICVATSIAPRNFPRQKHCLASWLDAGFSVVSLNKAEEIDLLREEFPRVEFVLAQRDAAEKFKRPYMYFDDVLSCLRYRNLKVGGIINSDIELMDTAWNLGDAVLKRAENSLVFGSRLDIKSPGDKEGKIYELGFDYFFFGENLLTSFPKEDFCLGLPWWDYWAVLVPLKMGVPVKRLVTPAVSHIWHKTAWNHEIWFKLGIIVAKHIPPPQEITASKTAMTTYLQRLAFKINSESRDIVL